MNNISAAQKRTQKALIKKGFKFEDWFKSAQEESSSGTPFTMVHRKKGQRIEIAEVEADGSVCGQTVSRYLKSI